MTTAVRTPTRLVPSDDVNAYARWVRRQRAYGRWQPFMDAQPVRAHLMHVMATTGLGFRQLADHAGVPRGTVSHILYGSDGNRTVRVTAENARRLLSLQANQTRGITLPSAGTRRRIQVLIGEGWPQVHLGPQFGTHMRYVNALLKVESVATSTAEAVADAYKRLQDTDPLTCGVTPFGVSVAKRLAARKQWPDRTFWDDVDRIDDPAFDPAPVLADTPKYVRLAEDALWLEAQGHTRQQIANRLGESADYITKSITRYRNAQAQQQAEVAV